MNHNTHLIISNTSLFQHFLVLFWQSSNPSCSVAINEWHKGEMWQMVVNETNIHSIHYQIRITKLHNERNGMDICLTNNHLPDSSFISLIIMIWKWNQCWITPKTKTDKYVEFKQHYSFTTILLHIPVWVLAQKITCWYFWLQAAIVDFTTLLCSVRCIACNCLCLLVNYLTLCEGLVLTKNT